MSANDRYLTVRYDVTGFTDEEIGNLAFEAEVQGERSKGDDDYAGHPSAPVEVTMPDGWEPKPRTIEVHLGVHVPTDDSRDAAEIATAILAAIEVGADNARVHDLIITDLHATTETN